MPRRIAGWLMGLTACVGLVLPVPVHASDVQEVCATYSATDVSVTTTAETVVATSDVCTAPQRPFLAVIKTSFTITTAASSATYKVRIRRATLTGTALGDAISRTIQVAAGGIEEVNFVVAENRGPDISTVQYVATIEIASAAGTSTVGEAYIEVMLL